MLELLATVTVPPSSVRRQRSENTIIIGRQTPASTLKSFTDFCQQMEAKRTSATSQVSPVSLEDEDVFISPIKRSVMVSAKFVVGGRIIQPPIDNDEVVDFD